MTVFGAVFWREDAELNGSPAQNRSSLQDSQVLHVQFHFDVPLPPRELRLQQQ